MVFRISMCFVQLFGPIKDIDGILQSILTRGVNCSVPYTINALGGGHMVLKTLTTVEGNCGGLTSYP